jgi:hypothetical protein
MKSTIIKFRATRRLKTEIEEAADHRGITVSDLLRSAANHIAAGRAADGGVRADMAKVRQAANALLALLGDGTITNPEGLARVMNAAEVLRQIAQKHLGAAT